MRLGRFLDPLPALQGPASSPARPHPRNRGAPWGNPAAGFLPVLYLLPLNLAPSAELSGGIQPQVSFLCFISCL